VATEFIGEDDLSTFEGWLKSQTIDAATATSESGRLIPGKSQGSAIPLARGHRGQATDTNRLLV
jgi:hypothetical protein